MLIFLWRDYFTSQNEVLMNPYRVQNEASLMGWEYAFSNIEETKIILKNIIAKIKSLDELIYEEMF